MFTRKSEIKQDLISGAGSIGILNTQSWLVSAGPRDASQHLHFPESPRPALPPNTPKGPPISATLSRLSTPAPSDGPNSSPGIHSFLSFLIHSPRCAGQKFQSGRVSFPLFRRAAKPTSSSPIQRPTRFKFAHFRLQYGNRVKLRPPRGGARGNAVHCGEGRGAPGSSLVAWCLCCATFASGSFVRSLRCVHRNVQTRSWCFCPVFLEGILLCLKWTETRPSRTGENESTDVFTPPITLP